MTVAADFKSAWRNVRRGGWLSATVLLILGVAIGCVTAIFSVAHAVLIEPLPIDDPGRAMLLWGRDDVRSQQVVEVSLVDQRAWLAGQKASPRSRCSDRSLGVSCTSRVPGSRFVL